jgi:hypothetical protein
MPSQIQYRGTSEQLRRTILSFIASLSGRAGHFAPYVRGIKLRVGMVVLSRIQEAFVAKSLGGVGEDGIAWPALKKQTIANRPLGPGDKSLMRGYGAHNGRDVLGRIKRGFLTPEQDKRWRKIFGSRKAMLMAKHGMDAGAASARAAQIAWATLKAEGAKTKLEVLGNRRVLIGRSSGRLFNSLSPGTANPEEHALLENPPDAPEPADRILREEVGSVIVGSAVKYAGSFHAKRPLWPDQLPAPWSAAIEEAAASGVAEALEMILGSEAGKRVA